MDGPDFSMGEPTKVGSRQGLVEEWEMTAYGNTYRVIAAQSEIHDEFFVMLSGKDAEWDAIKTTWTTMRGGRTGGVVTADWIRANFGFGSNSSEYLAVLVASALGRPHSVVPSLATTLEPPT